MKLRKIKNGVSIKFDNEMEKNILGLFLYHADLKSKEAIFSLEMFDNLALNDTNKDEIKCFIESFTTSFMQLAEDGRGCPDGVTLHTDIFKLYELLPDFLVGLSVKDGIQVVDLHNPFDWLFGEITT